MSRARWMMHSSCRWIKGANRPINTNFKHILLIINTKCIPKKHNAAGAKLQGLNHQLLDYLSLLSISKDALTMTTNVANRPINAILILTFLIINTKYINLLG